MDRYIDAIIISKEILFYTVKKLTKAIEAIAKGKPTIVGCPGKLIIVFTTYEPEWQSICHMDIKSDKCMDCQIRK